MKSTLKYAALVMVGVLVLGVLYFQFGERPAPLPDDLESARILEEGDHRVVTWEPTLVDSSRATRAYGDFPGADSRTLETTIWYPGDLVSPRGDASGASGASGAPGAPGASVRPLPVLVYSHGFMSQRTGGAYLAEHLAGLGYIVASMDYPLTQGGAPAGPFIADVANQPADVSFLLDRFLAWNLEQGHRFQGAVDEDRIGVFGLSLGGLTSTLAAFHPRTGDPRIDAAVSIAGPTFMLDASFFGHRDLPFMMIGATADAIVNYDANAAPVLEKDPDALLVTVEGGSHVGFADMAEFLRFVDNPDDLGCTAIAANVEDDDPWWRAIGSPEEGILARPPDSPLCAGESLPEAMNPIRQQRITVLAVTAFFQSNFSEDPGVRARHESYLTETFPSELPAVRVTGAGP